MRRRSAPRDKISSSIQTTPYLTLVLSSLSSGNILNCADYQYRYYLTTPLFRYSQTSSLRNAPWDHSHIVRNIDMEVKSPLRTPEMCLMAGYLRCLSR